MLAFFQLLVAALTPSVIKPDPLPAEPGVHRVVAVRDGYRLQELPVGQGAEPQRSHTFDDIPSFAAWLKRHVQAEDAEVFASLPGKEVGGSVVAISHNAWVRDTATCRLALDPAFSRLLSYLGKPYSQADMLSILRPIKPRLGPSGETMIAALAALKIEASAKVSQVIDSRTGSVKARLVSQDTQHDIPGEASYTGPVYLQGATQTLNLTLMVGFDGSKMPVFTLNWPERETAMADGFFAEVAALRGLLGEGWLVSLGSLGVEALREPRHNDAPKRVEQAQAAPVPAPSRY